MAKEGGTSQWPSAQGFSLRDRELVESLWDDARTARLSELYYGERIGRLTRLNFSVELLVAIAASGSGIAGWAVWQDKIGAAVWAIVAGAAAILAIAKPLMALDRKLRHCTRQQQQYRAILADLEGMAFDIQQSGSLTAEHRRRYQRARELLRQAGSGDDADTVAKQLTRIQERVNQEMPPDSLWVPALEPEPHPT